jgi:DNA-binding MarR family transcriptional regulator
MLKFNVFPIAQSPGRIVSRTHWLLKLGLSRAFADAGYDNLTPEHWAVLSVLWETDGLQQAELADMISKDRPNITRILDLLESNGFVRREPDPNDRRIRHVFLTKQGRKAKDRLISLAMDFLQNAMAGVTQADFNAFIRVNEKIAKNMVSILG